MGKCVSIFRRPRRDRFDASDQSINSIDRGLLNEELIGEVERAAVPIFFRHKLHSANFDGKKLQFATPSGQEPSTEVEVDFDFCVGADGSHSNVRRQLMRVLRYAISHTIRKPRVLTLSKLMDGSGHDSMDYQQKYIPDEYLELRIPAGVGGDGTPVFKMDSGHLHIWPRHSFMLIALPNKVSLLLVGLTLTMPAVFRNSNRNRSRSTHALPRTVLLPLLYSRLRAFLTIWKRHKNSSVGLMATFQTHCN